MNSLFALVAVVCVSASARAVVRINPNPNRVSLAHLQSIAFSKNTAMSARWRAVTSAARLYGPRAEHFLEQAMIRPEWFLRDAAIVASHYGDRRWAIHWSQVMLDDPALVVRTSAVESLRRLHAMSARPRLWAKLYSSENYRHGDSLWIRKNIAETLSEMATRADSRHFKRLLTDRDPSLRRVAELTLRRLYRQ